MYVYLFTASPSDAPPPSSMSTDQSIRLKSSLLKAPEPYLFHTSHASHMSHVTCHCNSIIIIIIIIIMSQTQHYIHMDRIEQETQNEREKERKREREREYTYNKTTGNRPMSPREPKKSSVN